MANAYVGAADLLRYVGFATLVTAVLLGYATVVRFCPLLLYLLSRFEQAQPPTANSGIISSDAIIVTTAPACTFDPTISYVLFGYLGCMLMVGMWLSYRLRDVVCFSSVCVCVCERFGVYLLCQPERFNESRRIGYIIYGSAFSALLLIPVCFFLVLRLLIVSQLDYALTSDPNAELAIRVVGMLYQISALYSLFHVYRNRFCAFGDVGVVVLPCLGRAEETNAHSARRDW